MSDNRIAIYSCISGTTSASAIHHFLTKSNQTSVGPSVYLDMLTTPDNLEKYKSDPDKFIIQAQEYFASDSPVTQIILEDRSEYNSDDKSSIYHYHQESLRKMANDKSIDNVSYCTTDYYDRFLPEYDKVVWSKYYGGFKDSVSYLDCDRLIFVESSIDEELYDYITGPALRRLDEEKIHYDSELWWKDHVYNNNVDVGKWREVWYNDYHEQCILDYHAGKLKYMWQLNFAHWDVWQAINNNVPKIELNYSHSRLFQNKKQSGLTISTKQKRFVKLFEENNFDYKLIPQDWYNYLNEISKYTGIEITQEMLDWLELYRAFNTAKRMYYMKTYWKEEIKFIGE